MSMHIVHAGLSDINTTKSKKKLTAKQIRAKIEHEAWLKQHGLHQDQLAARKSKATKLRKSFVMNKDELQCSNGFARGGFKTSVFDSNWNKRYEDNPELAAREAIALRKAEELKKSIAPAYSKGAYQLITKGSDLKTLGRKI